MQVGSIVTLRTIKDRVEDGDGKLVREITYNADKGSMFVVLVLGTVGKGEKFTVAKYDAALKNVGLMEIPEPAEKP